jgi:hypothetical protein
MSITLLLLINSCSRELPYGIDQERRIAVIPVDEAGAELTVSGKTASGQAVYLSREALEVQFPEYSFRCIDPWLKKEVSYTGISLYQLINSIGIDPEATRVRLVASNDYVIEVPLADTKQYYYQLTYKEDGRYYSELPAEQNKGTFAVSIDFNRFKALSIDQRKLEEVWWLTSIELR